MPTRRAFIAALGVSFVVVSVVADSDATERIVTGTVVELQAGEWISVSNDQTDPIGVRIVLRETTVYEGGPATIKPGDRVTVWHQSVGERRPAAVKVRVDGAAIKPDSIVCAHPAGSASGWMLN